MLTHSEGQGMHQCHSLGGHKVRMVLVGHCFTDGERTQSGKQLSTICQPQSEWRLWVSRISDVSPTSATVTLLLIGHFTRLAICSPQCIRTSLAHLPCLGSVTTTMGASLVRLEFSFLKSVLGVVLIICERKEKSRLNVAAYESSKLRLC
ncbi:unnamed protein product [Dicrocoelium dendriticum]|nr:unnamed protein product [Dicrocoelium dendriticum]